MSESTPPRWTGPARPNVDESRWQAQPRPQPPVQPEVVPSGPSYSDRYLAEIARNTKTIANWATLFGVLLLLSMVLWVIIAISLNRA